VLSCSRASKSLLGTTKPAAASWTRGALHEPAQNITINEYYGDGDDQPDTDFENADFEPEDRSSMPMTTG